jgi:hypothetical protein
MPDEPVLYEPSKNAILPVYDRLTASCISCLYLAVLLPFRSFLTTIAFPMPRKASGVLGVIIRMVTEFSTLSTHSPWFWRGMISY